MRLAEPAMCKHASKCPPGGPAGALTAYGVLRATSTVLESIHMLPHLYAQVGAAGGWVGGRGVGPGHSKQPTGARASACRGTLWVVRNSTGSCTWHGKPGRTGGPRTHQCKRRLPPSTRPACNRQIRTEHEQGEHHLRQSSPLNTS